MKSSTSNEQILTTNRDVSSGELLSESFDYSSQYSDKLKNLNRNFTRLLQSTTSTMSSFDVGDEPVKCQPVSRTQIGRHRIKQLKDKFYNEQTVKGSVSKDSYSCCDGNY